MKCLEEDLHILHVLKNTKCEKIRRAILSNCGDSVIKLLSDIVHNILLNKEIKPLLDPKTLKQLREKKEWLRDINSALSNTKSKAKRRKVFVNQKGGIWGPLITAALGALFDYGISKFSQKDSRKSAE